MTMVGLAGVSRQHDTQIARRPIARSMRFRVAARHRNPLHAERLQKTVNQARGAAIERGRVHDGRAGPRHA